MKMSHSMFDLFSELRTDAQSDANDKNSASCQAHLFHFRANMMHSPYSTVTHGDQMRTIVIKVPTLTRGTSAWAGAGRGAAEGAFGHCGKKFTIAYHLPLDFFLDWVALLIRNEQEVCLLPAPHAFAVNGVG